MEPVPAVLAAVNAAAFALMGIDKALARSRRRRVPEWVLAFGPTPAGVAGTVLGMFVFRHKVRKPTFWAKVAANAVLAALLLGASGIVP